MGKSPLTVDQTLALHRVAKVLLRHEARGGHDAFRVVAAALDLPPRTVEKELGRLTRVPKPIEVGKEG